MAYNGFSLTASDGLESKSMLKRYVDKLRRRVWLRRVCFVLLLVGLAAVVAFMGFEPNQSPSDRSLLSFPSTNVLSFWSTSGTAAMHTEDVITMDKEVLVLVRKPPGSSFPCKNNLKCRYGDATRKPTALHLYHHRAALLCPAPPTSFNWDVNSIHIAVGQDAEILPKVTVLRRPLQWSRSGLQLTYEAFSTETDVVVLVHGLSHSRGSHLTEVEEEARLRTLTCVYGGYYETQVTAQAQEVFRCAHPPVDLVHQFAGRRISVKYQERILPSVAYYHPELNPNLTPENSQAANTTPAEPSPAEHSFEGSVNRKPLEARAGAKHHVCSCTMIYNGAKFLNEWVYYNSHLGVTKFFLYDNNSDDDLDGVIRSLRSRGFHIQKQPWPWVKTQEAGFSHCSVLAQSECEWMLFTDVDEFLFPSQRFRENASSSAAPEAVRAHGERAAVPAQTHSPPARSITKPARSLSPPAGKNSSTLARFITAAKSERGNVGQICTFCFNFGPSGLSASPQQGVTQGYTCRMRTTQRHKSLVLLSALVPSLENVIHHFTLRREYGRKFIEPGTAVINHYKFQAWEEFKTKFHRRAATYVVDWTDDRNLRSNDRVPNLGTKPVKPADWESRYCEVHDYGLKNYTQTVFGSYDGDHNLHLRWE